LEKKQVLLNFFGNAVYSNPANVELPVKMTITRLLLFLMYLLLVPAAVSAQAWNPENPPHAPDKPLYPVPVPVPALSDQRLSADKYAEQEQAWMSVLRRDGSQPAYWLNAYRAIRYADALKTNSPVTVLRSARLDSLVNAMPESCRNSFEYNYLAYLNSANDPTFFPQLQRAYQLAPDRPELNREFVFHYAVTGQKDSLKFWLRRWENYFRNDSALLHYGHNMLAGLERGAVLFTGSETDAFPVLAEQQLRGFRTDVLVVCLAAFHNDGQLQQFLVDHNLNEPEHSYTKNQQADLLQEFARWNLLRPFYFAASVEQKTLTALQQHLFITGLAMRYSEPGYSNLPELYKNITTVYGWSSGSLHAAYWIPQLEMNYVLPLLLVAAEERKKGNTAQANAWENKALTIATKAGRKNDVKKYLARGG
jgi:hypothetical protein